MKGTIVKAISGFYYLKAETTVYECKARGIFKNKGIIPLVGDEAMFECDGEQGLVTEILPRKNSFDRPPLANVDCLIIVMAAADPIPSFEILDKFIVTAEAAGVEIALCLNKCDLAGPDIIDEFKSVYSEIYPLFFLCGTGASHGDEEKLRSYLQGKRAAMAGPSGVGKSTLSNLLLERTVSETGDISRKSLRGKNTTRHTQLFDGDGFSLFDTPGFTSFDTVLNDEKLLENLFPEFENYLGKCRFDDCHHFEEPDCAIRLSVESGNISDRRYQSYKNIYKYIVDNKKYK